MFDHAKCHCYDTTITFAWQNVMVGRILIRYFITIVPTMTIFQDFRKLVSRHKGCCCMGAESLVGLVTLYAEHTSLDKLHTSYRWKTMSRI